jgi:hypothetical protein
MILALLLIALPIGLSMEEPPDITVTNGKIDGVSGFRALNFVDYQTDSLENYDLKWVGWPRSGTFLTYPEDSDTGKNCIVGDYIVYKFTSGSRDGYYIFDEVWKKMSSSDLPDFDNYYTNGESWFTDESFDYNYNCYIKNPDSEQEEPIDDFEKGCLTNDATACVSKSHNACDIDYTYQSQCLLHIKTDTGECAKGCGGSGEKTPLVFSNPILNAESDDEQIETGDTITASVTVTATVAGDYFLEMGSNVVSGLAVVDISGNTCNPQELHYSNQLVGLDAGANTVTFNIIPKQGTNELWFAQVEECGGSVINRFNMQKRVSVGSVGEAESATSSGGVGFGSLGVGALILALIALGIYFVTKK